MQITTTFNDFLKIDIRAGTIKQAEVFAEAHKPAFKLYIDFGPILGLRRTSAQITENYKIEELIGRQIAAVINFPPKQIGPFMSEVLILGFPDQSGKVVLIQPERSIADGVRLF